MGILFQPIYVSSNYLEISLSRNACSTVMDVWNVAIPCNGWKENPSSRSGLQTLSSKVITEIHNRKNNTGIICYNLIIFLACKVPIWGHHTIVVDLQNCKARTKLEIAKMCIKKIWSIHTRLLTTKIFTYHSNLQTYNICNPWSIQHRSLAPRFQLLTTTYMQKWWDKLMCVQRLCFALVLDHRDDFVAILSIETINL